MNNEFTPEEIKKFKWPITISKSIEASAQDVWKVISNPMNLEDCHPFCESNPVEKWPGVGSIDTIYYYSGWVMQRKFTNWIDGVGYDLTIGRESGRKSFVSWRITEEQDNISKLSITIYPHVLQNVPLAVRWLPHFAYIGPSMKKYLHSVVGGFDHFITTGKPVSRNQFGSHSWFSSAS